MHHVSSIKQQQWCERNHNSTAVNNKIAGAAFFVSILNTGTLGIRGYFSRLGMAASVSAADRQIFGHRPKSRRAKPLEKV